MMKQNKKGAGLMIAIPMAILIFMAGMLFLNFIKPEVTIARDANNLDCANSTITDGNKVACLGVDVVVPYFILIVLSVSGGAIIAKFLL